MANSECQKKDSVKEQKAALHIVEFFIIISCWYPRTLQSDKLCKATEMQLSLEGM